MESDPITFGYRVPGGRRISVRLAAPEIQPLVASLYSSYRDDDAGHADRAAELALTRRRDTYVLQGPGGSWRYTAPGPAIVDYESELAGLLLEQMPPHVRIHAAAVLSEDRLLLILGASGAGKSTLALGLHLRGLTALADDAVLLDPATAVRRPFERPLRVHSSALAGLGLDPKEVPGSWFADPYLWLTPGEDPRDDPGPPHGVVFLERGGSNHLEELSASRSLARLLRGRMSEHAARDFRCLSVLAARADGFRLEYEDLGQALDALQRLAR